MRALLVTPENTNHVKSARSGAAPPCREEGCEAVAAHFIGFKSWSHTLGETVREIAWLFGDLVQAKRDGILLDRASGILRFRHSFRHNKAVESVGA